MTLRYVLRLLIRRHIGELHNNKRIKRKGKKKEICKAETNWCDHLMGVTRALARYKKMTKIEVLFRFDHKLSCDTLTLSEPADFSPPIPFLSVNMIKQKAPLLQF